MPKKNKHLILITDPLLTNRTEFGTLRRIIWDRNARITLSTFPKEVRGEIGDILFEIQQGIYHGMPKVRPMNSVMSGVFEIRSRGPDGIYRVFYFMKHTDGIIAFHAFNKKTAKTSGEDIKLGRERLKRILRSHEV